MLPDAQESIIYNKKGKLKRRKFVPDHEIHIRIRDRDECWYFHGHGAYNYVYRNTIESADSTKVLKIPIIQTSRSDDNCLHIVNLRTGGRAYLHLHMALVKEPTLLLENSDRIRRIVEELELHKLAMEAESLLFDADDVDNIFRVQALQCNYIEGNPAGDSDIASSVVDIYGRTRRVVIDGCTRGNFLIDGEGETVCVDPGMALRRDSDISRLSWQQLHAEYVGYWGFCREKSGMCLSTWAIQALMALEFDSNYICPWDERGFNETADDQTTVHVVNSIQHLLASQIERELLSAIKKACERTSDSIKRNVSNALQRRIESASGESRDNINLYAQVLCNLVRLYSHHTSFFKPIAEVFHATSAFKAARVNLNNARNLLSGIMPAEHLPSFAQICSNAQHKCCHTYAFWRSNYDKLDEVPLAPVTASTPEGRDLSARAGAGV